jgi:hypothetical protein
VAPALGIPLTDGELADAEAQRIAHDIDEDDGLWIEKRVWLDLF